MRITALLASVVQLPVVGLHSSAAWTAPAALLNPGAPVPPVTSTSPVGSRVPLIWRRAHAIDQVDAHVGVGRVRSKPSAVVVGGSPPPPYTLLPRRDKMADPVTPHRPQLRRGPTLLL